MSTFVYRTPKATTGLGYYSKLDEADIIDRLIPIFQHGGYIVTPSGKIQGSLRVDATTIQTPWLHQKHAPGLKCNLWHYIMFNHFGWFVPSQCQECWKVVVAPRTVVQLFELKDLQKELGMPSKCGIEVREYTSKLYGGYFYNRGFYNGRKCFQEIRKAVDDRIGKDVPVILKRACTEYEMKFPKSSTWNITEEQMKVEDILEDRVEDSSNPGGQPDIVRRYVKRTWLHWAFACGDQTYKEYTDGKPLYPGYETYHDRSLEECEMALNLGLANNRQMDLGKLDALSKDLAKTGERHGADLEDVAMALGFRRQLRPEFIGEYDELTRVG